MKTRERLDRLQVALLFALIWLPALGAVVRPHARQASPENRVLAPVPDPGSPLPVFLAAVDDFVKDHLGFRDSLIRIGYRIRLALGVSPRRDVLLGEDGWLSYDGDGSLDDHRGLRPRGEHQRLGWGPFLAERQRWLGERGVRFLFVVAPDKETIYPERLPAGFHVPGARSRLDLLVEDLSARGVSCLDLRPALKASKGEDLLYHAHDTHWNDLGAFVAHRELVRQLGLEPLDAGGYERRLLPHPGDLLRFLHMDDVREVTKLVPRQTPGARRATPGLEDLLDLPADIEAWRRPVAYEHPGRPGRALVLRDSSFALSMEPFLVECFGRTTLLSMHLTDDALRRIVDREQPEVVIEQHTERMLVYGPSGP